MILRLRLIIERKYSGTEDWLLYDGKLLSQTGDEKTEVDIYDVYNEILKSLE